MIYGNSTATFSSKLRETTRLLRPRGRKFARARLSRSPGYLYVIRGDLQPSPAAFIAIIAPEVEVRDPRQPRFCTRAFLSRFKRKPPRNRQRGRPLRGIHVAFLYDFLSLEELLSKSKGSSRATEIYILFFVEGVVGLVRGLILERRWWKMWLNWNVEYWNVII